MSETVKEALWHLMGSNVYDLEELGFDLDMPVAVLRQRLAAARTGVIVGMASETSKEVAGETVKYLTERFPGVDFVTLVGGTSVAFTYQEPS